MLSRFLGFVTTGVPLGVTFSFLISAPMVNEIAVVLLYGLFGWRIAAIYTGTGLLIAMVAGWVIGRLKMERYLEEWVHQIQVGNIAIDGNPKGWVERIRYGFDAVRDIVGKMQIAGYGEFGTPAVVVDGEVKSVGKIPTKQDVGTWLK